MRRPVGIASCAVLCCLAAACTEQVQMSAVLPAAGDLAVVALVESDLAGEHPVRDHSDLIPVAAGGAPLASVVDQDGRLLCLPRRSPVE
jgi:hypothetical protein